MENKNSIKKWFSFIWLAFFPFVVSWLLSDNEEYSLSDKDIDFIASYQKLGWLNIFLVLLGIILLFLSAYFNFYFLATIWQVLIFFVFLNILVHVFFIYQNKFPIFVSSSMYKISFFSYDKSDNSYFFYYLPFVSYYLWLKILFQNDSGLPNDLLKEANFMYFLLFLIAFLIYFFPSLVYVFYVLVFVILLRLVGLLVGVDFGLFNFYSTYEKFPYEILAYVEWFVYFLVKNLIFVLKWKKTISYLRYVKQIQSYYQTGYDLNLTLKKTRKYLFLLLSYVVLISFLLYIFWQSFYLIDSFIVIVFWVLWLLYLFLLPVKLSRKLFPLPFLSLVFYQILRKF